MNQEDSPNVRRGTWERWWAGVQGTRQGVLTGLCKTQGGCLAWHGAMAARRRQAGKPPSDNPRRLVPSGLGPGTNRQDFKGKGGEIPALHPAVHGRVGRGFTPPSAHAASAAIFSALAITSSMPPTMFPKLSIASRLTTMWC